MVRGDKGYSYPAVWQTMKRRGIPCVIPERRDQRRRRREKGRKGGRPRRFEKAIFRERNVVERCFLRLKQFRRVATRYDKEPHAYLAFVTLASLMLWLR
jgi:transposase